ncbi:hypothetical protein HanXRQr2_Chr14g0664571 [Helianthus annuus]|uniref:Uncharacterized protein n=1 Tax=Helianthus annuus TaxID=4232 RepID=A0A9K3EE27_HELAN|nr:hypothetical protein HanXRQr2_Chr14g0664571 [Helianthus annuus]KAJ0465759.1 hypothetical protein HanHA300_Chr14g0541681 [Helianthus annuus]KAJ0487353.1 hypothetical protein HanHA89_Chr14g0589461 [Helianthus annuus]KAJ0842097.1 hypothetical protein HanPSC8_Chr14g0637801 [Helianthus annuus]
MVSDLLENESSCGVDSRCSSDSDSPTGFRGLTRLTPGASSLTRSVGGPLGSSGGSLSSIQALIAAISSFRATIVSIWAAMAAN